MTTVVNTPQENQNDPFICALYLRLRRLSGP
jgi:hypothetical protein